LHVAASDSHGHVLFLGPSSAEAYQVRCRYLLSEEHCKSYFFAFFMCLPVLHFQACPEEMFFHTDYRPLLRDAAHHVVDEQVTDCNFLSTVVVESLTIFLSIVDAVCSTPATAPLSGGRRR